MFGRRIPARCLFESTVLTEALNRALYLIEARATFGLVHGPDGSGRTVLLRRLQEILHQRQVCTVFLNAAVLDADSLLCHIAAALGAQDPSSGRRGELLLKIRDELSGRGASGVRTVFLLDDLHRTASDISAVVQYCTSACDDLSGMVTVVAASRTAGNRQISDTPTLDIQLTGLSMEESRDFVAHQLERYRSGGTRPDWSAIHAVSELAGGIPARLVRLCELLQVVQEASPEIPIDQHVVREVARQLIPRAVA